MQAQPTPTPSLDAIAEETESVWYAFAAVEALQEELHAICRGETEAPLNDAWLGRAFRTLGELDAACDATRATIPTTLELAREADRAAAVG